MKLHAFLLTLAVAWYVIRRYTARLFPEPTVTVSYGGTADDDSSERPPIFI